MTRGFIVWVGASGRAFAVNTLDGVAVAPKGFEAAGVHGGILLHAIRAKEAWLRLRYPNSAPIKSVTMNGEDWSGFGKDNETIELKSLTGSVAVAAHY
jgi:hypothetical protein